ncbi:MAG: prephenate dehydratase [Lachnospiraceae bacterium]|nr:prephenate dehydratase [Lachnospiraceae bacterium]
MRFVGEKVIAAAIIVSVAFSGCVNSGKSKEISQSTEALSYESAKVSYLGPKGTYTNEACEVFFENKGEYLPYETVNDAVQALNDGESDYAVIPQENTIGGAVIDYVDTLIANTDVFVAGEVELTINQNLLALPGTKVEDIKTVYSHKQGIAQGKAWMEKNLPEAEVIEASSTAEGAKIVSEGGDASCAAIASAGCAEVYGLEVIAKNIQENDNNKTRFYVLSKDDPAMQDGDRLAFIAAGPAEKLPELLSKLKDQKMKLVTIHDRPRKTVLGEYYYLIECSDTSYEKYKKLAENDSFEFRYLGNFDTY